MRVAGIIVGVLMILFGGGCILTAGMAGGQVMAIGLPPFIGGLILTLNAWGKKPGEEFSTWAKAGIVIAGIIFGLACIVALMALISLAVEFW